MSCNRINNKRPFTDVDPCDESRSKASKIQKYKEPRDVEQPRHGSIAKRLRDEASSDDGISVHKRARLSSTPILPFHYHPHYYLDSSYITQTSAQPLQPKTHLLDHLNGATPEQLRAFKVTTAYWRQVLAASSPSSVATAPDQPQIHVKVRVEIKKDDRPYVPSKLSGVKRAGKRVVKTIVDQVL
ncbi:hypothetical protein HDU81_009881, partial [Chytriomyces hyalinus]